MSQEDFYRGIAVGKQLSEFETHIMRLEKQIINENSGGTYAVIPTLESQLFYYKSKYDELLKQI